MTHVTEGDLDDLEFDSLRTGDHRSAAVTFADWADNATTDEGLTRAMLLLRAGEQFQHAGEHSHAAEVYRRAIEDGGETYGDARVYLADALLKLGDNAGAIGLLAEIRESAPTDPEVFRSVAEILYEHGDLLGAHTWSTHGADLVLALPERTRGDAAESLEGLLRLRFRARVDLGRPEDEYDALLDA
ncbi:tetratricopeptide repeat protein [Actinocorallia herbida]|uniref:Tetratricopeptide repeat protein n=1 Tax=Actinocorallia herbida TaxID=58109 RepID=A0A3N1DAK9_9ACTN|nr:tetratricopeptide repeat protein [Actinocorallia herbida]ROO90529.1 tetratricopeptide repeat protein [Actinocorallia herbida]